MKFTRANVLSGRSKDEASERGVTEFGRGTAARWRGRYPAGRISKLARAALLKRSGRSKNWRNFENRSRSASEKAVADYAAEAK
jgi:hypothetical protein